MKNIFTIFVSLAFLSGCASLKKSLLTGATIGAVGGGLIGNAQGQGSSRNRSTNNGLLIGAALGAGIGYLAHKNNTNKLTQTQLKIHEEDTPLLTRPKVKRIWVEDKIQGRRFIKGHWEFVIEEQSEWSSK